jgi:hypothetical protein
MVTGLLWPESSDSDGDGLSGIVSLVFHHTCDDDLMFHFASWTAESKDICAVDLKPGISDGMERRPVMTSIGKIDRLAQMDSVEAEQNLEGTRRSLFVPNVLARHNAVKYDA